MRTPKQRLTDVVVELLTSRDAMTGEFITESIGIKAKASTQVVLTAPVGVLDGTKPDRSRRDDRCGSRTPRDSPDSHSGHRVGRDDLRPGRPPTLVGPQPATRKRRPTFGDRHSRRRMLRMRRSHAPMRTPPHGGMAPRPRIDRHRQSGRRLPSTSQVVGNQQPGSPANPQRLPNPTPRRTKPSRITNHKGPTTAEGTAFTYRPLIGISWIRFECTAMRNGPG